MGAELEWNAGYGANADIPCVGRIRDDCRIAEFLTMLEKLKVIEVGR